MTASLISWHNDISCFFCSGLQEVLKSFLVCGGLLEFLIFITIIIHNYIFFVWLISIVYTLFMVTYIVNKLTKKMLLFLICMGAFWERLSHFIFLGRGAWLDWKMSSLMNI